MSATGYVASRIYTPHIPERAYGVSLECGHRYRGTQVFGFDAELDDVQTGETYAPRR